MATKTIKAAVHGAWRFGDGPWAPRSSCLQFIHKVNELAEGRCRIFDAPIGDVGDRDWGGERRYVEEYPEAWVVGPLAKNFDGWRILARTKRAEKYMKQAWAELNK